jgi:enoyl-CoA hydratase/carnithine racemase
MIERDTSGGIEIIRLAHGKASVLDVELMRELARTLDQLSDARAIVLTGTGSIFSAGVDSTYNPSNAWQYIHDNAVSGALATSPSLNSSPNLLIHADPSL